MSARENVTASAILPAQVRAARALLDWPQERLADVSGVPKRTVIRLEAGETTPQRRTVEAIRTALEAAGVEFTNGEAPGVRLRKGGS